MRALLSVYDKTGLIGLAEGLVALGWDLVASGGTSAALAAAGVPYQEVAEITGAPEMLGGRVKTLHPNIHGGILADRSKPQHLDDLAERSIVPIDLVACNLYPFRADPSVEMIDVGGPTMVRAAAKNHEHVAVVVDPGEYGPLLDELRREGELSLATRRRLARAAFAHTAAYDAAIVNWLDEAVLPPEELPPTVHIAAERVQSLRYGENPHQVGARYRTIGASSWWDDVVQHSGLDLSYLNLYDAEAAWNLVQDLATFRSPSRPVAAIIKHANPCGAAVADNLATAYRLAFECDEQSAFGGVVAVSGEIDEATCDAIVAAPQADVILAPSYAPGTLERLRAKRKNTRLLEMPATTGSSRLGGRRLDLRQIDGGFLVQGPHHFAASRESWRVVTKAAPTDQQWPDVELAWRIVGHVKSNAIVLVAGGQAVGIGAGQQKRVESGQIAASKAAGRARGGACASDAFYPMSDGVEAAAAAGVAVVIQPGGALRDDEVIAKADELGLAMVFTGERHFLH